MSEEWLVEAELSSMPWDIARASPPLLVVLALCDFTDILFSWIDMMNLRDLRGMPHAFVAT